jgi:large subunit ribosomal protein L15
MDLHSLPKITSKKLRRVGRGHGSGRVKTSGRGTKGQNAREKVGLKFAGSSLQASWLKRLPLLRGKGKNKSLRIKPTILSLKALNVFKDGSIVDLKALREKKLVGTRVSRVKVLGMGELKAKKLEIRVPLTKRSSKAT